MPSDPEQSPRPASKSGRTFELSLTAWFAVLLLVCLVVLFTSWVRFVSATLDAEVAFRGIEGSCLSIRYIFLPEGATNKDLSEYDDDAARQRLKEMSLEELTNLIETRLLPERSPSRDIYSIRNVSRRGSILEILFLASSSAPDTVPQSIFFEYNLDTQQSAFY